MKRFEQILALKRQGLTPLEIARQVSFSLATVYRLFKHESFPERKPRHGSIADYLPYLQTWVEAGCVNVSQLRRELLEQGYIGSSETVSAGVLLLHNGRTGPHLEPPPARYSRRGHALHTRAGWCASVYHSPRATQRARACPPRASLYYLDPGSIWLPVDSALWDPFQVRWGCRI